MNEMEPFRDLSDAGEQLGRSVRRYLLTLDDVTELTLAPILPNGVAVLQTMRAPLPPHVVCPLHVVRSEMGVDITVQNPSSITGRRVLVIDDGVETGTAARAAHAALQVWEPAEILLAVPVCSRQSIAELALRYDDIIAIHTPLGRRDLRWHYRNFDTIDDDQAKSVLAEMGEHTPGH
jgi:predicted phosphoribosyltransferase